MSFRKRGEVIGGSRDGAESSESKLPTILAQNSLRHFPIPNRMTGRIPGSLPTRVPHGIPNRVPSRAPVAMHLVTKTATLSDRIKSEPSNDVQTNPGVKPSLITSQPTISTGTADLDRILLHQGLPQGSLLLIEESGTTDYSAVLLRAYISQGITHNRLGSESSNVHCIVVGVSDSWLANLPGIYQGSKRDQQKSKILADQNKTSVANKIGNGDMKIAWRYGLGKPSREERSSGLDNVQNSSYPHYTHQFDITQRLHPPPHVEDISYVPISGSFQTTMKQIRAIISKYSARTIRIAIPGLLHPSVYAPECSRPTYIVPFLHALRALTRQYPESVTVMASWLLDLYPREDGLSRIAETLFDSAIHLQPFNQEMLQLIERAFKNEPRKQQQGLVNIIKLPILAERGLMTIHRGEYAYKNGKSRFEISSWGIPVEDDGGDGGEGNTTQSIDF